MTHHVWRLVRFAVVGTLNTLLYIAVFYLLLTILHFRETLAGTLAYILSIAFYYGAHRYFTFRSNASILREIYRLIPATALTYLVSLGLIITLSRGLLLSPGWVAVLAGGVTAATSYLLGYLWVFAQSYSKT